MALQRPLSKALGCSSCQRWILRSFIAAVGGQPSTSRRAQHPPPRQRRLFSSAARRLDEDVARSRNELQSSIANNDSVEQDPPLTQSQPPQPPTTQDAHLPWYLRVQQPLEPPSSPLLARQTLPELPDNPPPLLDPLLQHISMQLGMDDLTILDLRNIDPPPALGSNLLMLIGTARSERHLHVSADKLCRWLRTEHRLSPYADGLLGRGELKILMRRKAKRKRLLAGVGAKETGGGEVEDGVRTGWVCVNVGMVEGGDVHSGADVSVAEGVIGFGPALEGGGSGGCNIVVQLMTEEKRAEVELERLWEGVIAKAEKEKAKVEEGRGGDGAASDTNTAVPPEEPYTSPRTTFNPATLEVSNQSSAQRVRAYHTSACHLLQAPVPNAAANDIIELGEQTPSPMPAPSDSAIHDSESSKPIDNDPSLAALTTLLTDLKSMSREQALEALGPNLLQASSYFSPVDATTIYGDRHEDRRVGHRTPLPPPSSTPATITPWLETFYENVGPFPTPAQWHAHITLLCHARRLGHAETHSPVLVAQVKNMLLAGVVPEERTFILVITSMFTPLGPWSGSKWNSGGKAGLSRNKVRSVLGLLEDMDVCGYRIDGSGSEVPSLLHQAFFGSSGVGGRNNNDNNELNETAIESLDLKSMVPALRLKYLRLLAERRDWPSFWRTWRSYPQQFLPRSSEMYGTLFYCIRNGWLLDPDISHRGRVEALREAKETLRTCLEEMEMEDPPVMVEKDARLADAVKGALEWAEPGLKGEDGGARGAAREWRAWYERCEKAFEKGFAV